MALTLFYVPQNSMSWTNRGTAGSGYNATAVGTNRYGTGSTGYPYWGNFATSDAICIPAGSATNNQNTVTWQIGIRCVGTNGTGIQKIWDKGIGAYNISIQESTRRLYLQRVSNGGTISYYCDTTPLNTGHNYYIQISWSAGATADSKQYPSIYIGVDGTAPVAQSLSTFGSASGNWYNDAGLPANIANYSSGSACGSTSGGYWLAGNLYVYRQYDNLTDFSGSAKGMWYIDKKRWVARDADNLIEFNTFPSTGTTIVNQSSLGASYNGTANDNDYATLGSYTKWVMRDSGDIIQVPAGSFINDVDLVTFEWGFYYNAENAATNTRLFSKRNTYGEFNVSLWGGTSDRIAITRSTNGTEEVWVSDIGSLSNPPGWHWIGIAWDMKAGPGYVGSPVVVMDEQVITMTQQTAGTLDWAYDGNQPLCITNVDNGSRNLNGDLAIYREYNYLLSSGTMISHNQSDKARWASTELDSDETATLYPIEDKSAAFSKGETVTLAPVESAVNQHISKGEVATLTATEGGSGVCSITRAETLTLVTTEGGEAAQAATSSEEILIDVVEEYYADVNQSGTHTIYIKDAE